MPAVQLARLKDQIAALANDFHTPEQFQRGLHTLCEYYSDRTYRPGQAVPMAPLLPSFHIPDLVIRQLDQALEPYVQANPPAALALADRLWRDEFMEPRLVAIGLLGSLPSDGTEALVARLRAWGDPRQDRQLIRKLLSQASERLRRDHPTAWLEVINSWLGHNDAPFRAMGLRALLPLIEDENFENLPAIFSALVPVIQANPAKVQNELLEDLQALSRRSPMETTYFFRQMLSLSSDAVIVRLARKCLPLLGSSQSSLRNLLTERSLR